MSVERRVEVVDGNRHGACVGVRAGDGHLRGISDRAVGGLLNGERRREGVGLNDAEMAAAVERQPVAGD